MEKNKTYTNGEITILWQPEKCIHSGICVQMLPSVYKPGDHPWVHIENATTGELKRQIAACPSGALSYTQNKECCGCGCR
jgi:uncharacterized Fe-S cluster protein YjdI